MRSELAVANASCVSASTRSAHASLPSRDAAGPVRRTMSMPGARQACGLAREARDFRRAMWARARAMSHSELDAEATDACSRSFEASPTRSNGVTNVSPARSVAVSALGAREPAASRAAERPPRVIDRTRRAYQPARGTPEPTPSSRTLHRRLRLVLAHGRSSRPARAGVRMRVQREREGPIRAQNRAR